MGNTKKGLNKKEIREKLSSIIQRKKINLEIRGLTRDTRDLLSEIINGVLDNVGSNPLASFHIFSGIMEALLNALKGDIRYVIFKNELLKKISENESLEAAETLLEVILDTSPLRDAMQRYVVPDKIKKNVQRILTLEEKIRVKKQNLSEPEMLFLSEIREKIQKDNYKISLKIEKNDEDVFFRIRNDAPIMQLDLIRIEESRLKHHALAAEGKSTDFFRPEYLDEKESAGFGIAMIDEGYYNIGLNPLDHFSITTSSKATVAYFKYPIQSLQEVAF